MNLFENRRSFVHILESSESCLTISVVVQVCKHTEEALGFFCCLLVNMHTKMQHELVSFAAVEFYMSIAAPCAYITCLKTDLEIAKYKSHSKMIMKNYKR